MPESSGNGWHFEVHNSAALTRAFFELQLQATREGRGAELIRAVKEALRRLRVDPMNFGEPMFRLPALRLELRAAVVPPLVIQFAVSQDRPKVFIRSVGLLSRPED